MVIARKDIEEVNNVIGRIFHVKHQYVIDNILGCEF
jgi:hypothetical protein